MLRRLIDELINGPGGPVIRKLHIDDNGKPSDTLRLTERFVLCYAKQDMRRSSSRDVGRRAFAKHRLRR